MCVGVFLVAAALGSASPDADSHLILEAVQQRADARQPTWIALFDLDRRILHHLPANAVLFALPSGSYVVVHLDFQPSRVSGRGTLELLPEWDIRFALDPSHITYIGRIVITTKRRHVEKLVRNVHTLDLHRTQDLITHACRIDADVVERLPIRVFDPDARVPTLRAYCVTELPHSAHRRHIHRGGDPR